jgi:hypothetical protein
MDVSERTIIRHGFAANCDKQNAKTDVEDWTASIVRCIDDVVSDGPLGAGE